VGDAQHFPHHRGGIEDMVQDGEFPYRIKAAGSEGERFSGLLQQPTLPETMPQSLATLPVAEPTSNKL